MHKIRSAILALGSVWLMLLAGLCMVRTAPYWRNKDMASHASGRVGVGMLYQQAVQELRSAEGFSGQLNCPLSPSSVASNSRLRSIFLYGNTDPGHAGLVSVRTSGVIGSEKIEGVYTPDSDDGIGWLQHCNELFP
jgi:hypothetical protein